MKHIKFRIIGTFVFLIGALILWIVLNSTPAGDESNPDNTEQTSQ